MIEKKFECERLLEIDNVHEGDPAPKINAKDKYVGYFENAYGEQWVFVGDCKTGEAVIHGGDVDWEEYKVSRENVIPSGIILNDAETHWIISCFMAMSDATFDEVTAPLFAQMQQDSSTNQA